VLLGHWAPHTPSLHMAPANRHSTSSAHPLLAPSLPHTHPPTHTPTHTPHTCRHIIGGVEFSLELCRAGGVAGVAASLFRLGLGAVTPASAAQVRVGPGGGGGERYCSGGGGVAFALKIKARKQGRDGL
jgi:hypothetical protein